jgi:choice-of-anchor A domain-containing protein/uncharacterized repeat protein (TIGR01451 family)
MTKIDLSHFLSRLYLMIWFILAAANSSAQFNPTTGTYNFGVVTRGDATFWSGDTHSPVFVGGNLTITNAFDFSNNHSGSLTFTGDSKPAHLVVRGTINLLGQNNSNGHVNGGGYLKIGSPGTLTYGTPSGNPAAVSSSGKFLQVNEPSQTESSMMVTTAVIDNKINKETLFSSFKANSDQLKACGANTSITDEYGGRFSMQLQNNRTNVIAISKAQLTNLSEFIFKNQAPSASSPLLINVDMQGGSVDFSAPIYVGSGVNLGDINALGKYVIYNFYNGGTTNNTVNILYGTPRATIYAPYSKVVKKLSSGDIEGQVIADSYIHEGGEVHYQIFDADLSCENTVTECTGCASKNLIYNPDFSASNATDGWVVQTSSNNVSFGVFDHNFGGSIGWKKVGQLNWNDVAGDNYVRQVITNGVVPGKPYTFSAQAANHGGNSNPGRTKMWLEFLNSQGTVISSSVERNVTSAYGNFQNISITGTIPPNTAQVRIVGYANRDALKFLNSLLMVDCYDAVNATSVNVNANCLDQSGKITVNATGGSGQYQYYIKKGNGNWSSAQASNVFDNLTSSTYTIRVEDKNIDKAECKKEFNVVIAKDPIPAKPSVTNKEICVGESTTLTAGNCASGSTLKWYSNAGLTTEITNLTVIPAETKDYYAACVGTCKSEASKLTITVKPRLTISVDSKTICEGESATLTATNCTGNVTWNTGATGVTLAVNPAGTLTYTATCSKSGSCDATASGTVTVNPMPTVSVDSKTICIGESATLTATCAGGTATWNTGATGTTLTVSPTTSTTYTATCKSSTNCSATATGRITVHEKPTVTVSNSGNITCVSGSVITASATPSNGIIYIWTVPAGVTNPGNQASFTANVPGTYSVKVKNNATNCESETKSTVVTEDKNTPSITATGGELTCAKPNVTLTATEVAGAGYVWKLGTTEVGTTREVSVSEAGTYTVTVTFSNGCTSTATAVVTEDKNTPSITATGGELTCGTANVTLSATEIAGASYVWKRGTTEVGTTREVSVSVAGTYTVSVAFANGCTSTATAVVTEDKNTPAITATGGELTCGTANVTLSATEIAGASYVWKRGTTEVGTAREVSVSEAGMYTITVTFANGCTSTATAVVTEDKNTPSITATGGELTCAKPNVTLTATEVAGASYVWKRGTTEVGTTREVSVSVSGTYTVTVTFVNGCTSTATAVVTEDKNTPSITATGGELTCTKTSVTISATEIAGAIYIWKRGTTEVGTTREVSVSEAGTYTITVTFSNGCTSTATAVVTEDKNAPAITATGGELTCGTANVTLSATEIAGASYVWKLGTTEVGTTSQVTVSADGTYTVTVTFSNGCTTTATATVTKDTEVPTVIVEAGKLTCTTKKVTVVAAATGKGITYKWTVPNGVTNPGNVASFETETPGVYSVEVTSENGCKVTDQIEVIEDLTAPVVRVEDKVIACDLTEVTLVAEATGTVSYSWTGPAGFTSNSREITVSTVGTYTVTVTSLVNGCTATAQGVVTKQPNPAPPQAGPHKVCFGEEITLTAVCATGTAKWFSDADLTQQVTVLTFVPEETHTYYALCGLEDCFSEPTQSVVTVIPYFSAPKLSASPEEVIQGESSTLSGTCQTGTLVWYKDQALTEVLGTGATLVVTPPATTTYYAACEVEDCKKTSEIIVKVKDQIFDLALRKTIKGGAKNPVVYPGSSITFEIEIFNQGNVGASNVEVTDYIPKGLILADNAWTPKGTDKAVVTIDTLAPQASVVKEITFTVAEDFKGKAINAAEISGAEGGEDIDSTPDDDPTNDGTPKDDVIDEDGKNGGDEDDHDIEEITVEDKPVFDLALRKTIKGGAKNPIMKIGQEVTFIITVFNQGNVEAKNIEVVDYIPSGLTLVDTLNWNVVGNKAYLKTPIANLASSASQTIEVKFRINQSASGEVINFAEISNAENDRNLKDIDSTPDDDPSNDGVSKDDVITENGKEGGDEDDHDMEKIQICPDSKCLTAKVRVNK